MSSFSLWAARSDQVELTRWSKEDWRESICLVTQVGRPSRFLNVGNERLHQKMGVMVQKSVVECCCNENRGIVRGCLKK